MSIIEKIETLITPLLNADNMELVDTLYTAEGDKKLIRIFLDKEGGVKLSDCEEMSKKIGALLDEAPFLPDAYILEVSSPGLDRVLKKEKDFVRFAGRAVRITLYAPLDGQRNFTGKIVSTESEAVTITDTTSGKTVRIPFDKMARARLEPEI